MTMQLIPIKPTASQTFTIQLGTQFCKINLYQKFNGLYFDLIVNGETIVQTMICLNRVGLVRYAYLGFVGQLVFIDTQGDTDPNYEYLGTRYILAYIT